VTHKTYCYFSKYHGASMGRPKRNEKLDSDQREIHGRRHFDIASRKSLARSAGEFYGTALSIRSSPHDLYNGLYPERMRGQIGVTWTLRIYQLPSLAHLLYSHFVSSETFGNRPRRRQRKNATSVIEMRTRRFFPCIDILTLNPS